MARTLLVVSLVASTGALFVGCTQDFNVFKPGGGGAGSSTAVTSVVTSAQSTGVGGGGVDCTSTDLTMCEDNNVCTNESCIGGKCAHANVADGLKPGYVDNTADCVDDVCMGGVLMAGAPDNTEIPTAPNICSTPSCAAGLPVLTPDLTKNGMSCGAGILQCDAGDCVGCVVPTDCPVSATEPFCTMRTCSVTKVCGLAPDHEGTATPTGQTGNDCKSINCVAGVSTSQDANGDAPVSALPCKVGSCSGGVPATNFPVVNCGTAAQCPTATSQHLQDVCQGAAPGNCVAGATTNCTGSFNCTNNVCNASCADDTHCVTGKHCDTTVGSANLNKCVDCSANGDCSAPTPVCDVTAASTKFDKCVECSATADCSAKKAPAGHVCEVAASLDQCKCVADGDCVNAYVGACVAGVCGCQANIDCASNSCNVGLSTCN